MKKIKAVFLIIFITLFVIFFLTGCSDNNKKTDSKKDNTTTSISSNKNTNKKTKTKKEIKSNIEKEVLGITPAGDYVIKLKNRNDTQVYIDSISVRFFDENGNFAKKESTDDSFFCIPANSELVTYVWGYERDFEKYSKSEIELILEDPFYKYYTENFEIQSNDTNEEIAITITNNNNSALDCIKVNVAFFKEGQIVGIESGLSYEEGISSNGGIAYINVDYPLDTDYEEVSFDEFKVYLTSAYKE